MVAERSTCSSLDVVPVSAMRAGCSRGAPSASHGADRPVAASSLANPTKSRRRRAATRRGGHVRTRPASPTNSWSLVTEPLDLVLLVLTARRDRGMSLAWQGARNRGGGTGRLAGVPCSPSAWEASYDPDVR